MTRGADFAFVRRLTHRLQADFQRLAGVDFRSNLITGVHAVKERQRRKNTHRAIGPMSGAVVHEDLGIHEKAVQVFVINGLALGLFSTKAQVFSQFRAGRFKIDRRKAQAGAVGQGSLAFQDLLQNTRRPAAGGLAKVTFEHVHHRVREGNLDAWVFHLRAGQVLRYHHQRHVTDDLGRRRDLHDIAEHLVHIGIGLRDLMPAILKPQAARLRL
jgi:hypothetical protein